MRIGDLGVARGLNWVRIGDVEICSLESFSIAIWLYSGVPADAII
ncbi:hypothetical protein [Nostoc favosum]|nr:hypothetical protein [Nostoc favosum]